MFRKNNLLSEAEISYFCQQIHMIIKAGLPTYYGISILREETVEEDMQELLSAIYEPIERGATLYDALSPTGRFPNYMLQMIKIGEETGRLEEVLSSLSVYYEREAEIREGIKQAVTYPIIMSVMMLAVIIVIITKVVPIFSEVYAELGSSLVGFAKVLMDISTFLNQYLLALIIGVALIGLALFVASKTSAGKRFLDNRAVSRSLASSRLANCMYLALASGLDTDQGLSLAESLVANYHAEECIRKCKELISTGESFARALLLSGCFSEMYSSMIVIGYKTSAMDDVMLRVSKAYEKETDEKLHQFVSLLEPTLIIVLSFFIGLILISFLLPLLGIMSSIG
jgi:type IV pilus assembly protein PilC